MISTAYVDTSFLVSIAFNQSGSAVLSRRINSFENLISSNLLEAEFQAAFAREGRVVNRASLTRVSWILPERPLVDEIARVLEHGYVRGADCWHLATALYSAAQEPSSISFLTLDSRQRTIARALGFAA
ncbi:MAG TPA: PIN domain-containing protein [Gemmatimonadaceae bacterium]|nr:PIN domain-containing protein [Gemmatimonadaceae bacterium]